jgi:hypothetical protein
VSRLISFNKTGFQDSVQRLGIAFIMEGDLIGTAAGEIAYKRNIAGISQCCQETVNFHTIMKLLTCKDFMREQQDLNRAGSSKVSERQEEDELAEFAVLAYDYAAFIKMVERAKSVIRDARGEADTLIVFPGFPYYADMIASGVYTEYYRTGPAGIQLLTQGPVSNGVFRGIPIFETRGYSVYKPGIQYQPLLKNVAVGEYYEAAYDWRGKPVSYSYRSDHRSIYVYSLKDDEYQKLTFKSLFEHANLFGGGDGINDADELSPQTDVLADAANTSFNHTGGFDDEARRYGLPNLPMLENIEGSVLPKRRLFMMLAHNVAKRRVEKVRTFGEFDIDVATSADFIEVATSIVNRMFDDAGEQSDLQGALNSTEELVKRLRAVGYNEDYLRALIVENANASIDRDGNFYGWRRDASSPINWSQNAFNYLDLPRRVEGTSTWTDPVGAASYGGLKTIATQGLERGYSPELVEKAAAAVRAIDRLVKKLSDAMVQSGVMDEQRAANWLFKGTAEDAVFAALYGDAPPMMLGVPNADEFKGSVAPADQPVVPLRTDAGAANGADAPVTFLWGPSIDNNTPAAVIPAMMPRVRYLDVLLRSALSNPPALPTAASLWRTERSTTALDKYLLTLLASGTENADTARGELIDALFGVLDAYRGANEAPIVLDALAEYVTTSLKPPQVAADATPADLKRIWEDDVTKHVGQLRALSAKLPQVIQAKQASFTASQRTANETRGQAIVALSPGAGGTTPVPLFRGEGQLPFLVPMRSDSPMFEHIKRHVSAPAAESSQTSMATALLMMEEKFDTAARAAYRAGDPYVATLQNYSRWLDEIGNKRATKAEKTEVAKIGKQYTGYNAVFKEVNKAINESYKAVAPAAAAAQALSIGDREPRSQAAIDAGIATAGKSASVWFRSPLTNSMSLMRSLSQLPNNDLPLLLPTDPNSNYATAYVPYAKLGGKEFKFDKAKLAHISGDPSMWQINSDMTMASVKPLGNEQYIKSKQAFAPISATFFSTDTAKMVQYNEFVPVRGYVGESDAGPTFDLKAIVASARAEAYAAGMPFSPDDETAAIAEAMEANDAARAARGLKPANYQAEFTRVASDARADDQKSRVAAMRAAAISSQASLRIGETFTGPLSSNIGLSVIENARRNAKSMQSAGPRTRTEADVREARYHQALTRGGPFESVRRDDVPEFEITNVNRQFNTRLQERLELDAQEAAQDYLATDQAYRADDRTARFREVEGFDRTGVRLAGGYPNDTLGTALRTLQQFGWTAAPPPRPTTDSTNALHQNVVYRTQKANNVRSALLRAAYLALLATPNTYSAWHALIDQDVHVPINFLVWRLWIEFEMYSCILLQSGIETGANVLGHTNMVFSNTSVDKMMHGHFTYHHATMIWKQQFVNVLSNVMPGGYVCGWDTTFIESSEEIFTGTRKSIIVTAIPITEHNMGRKLCFIRTSVPRLLPSITDRPKEQTAVDDYSTAAHSELTWDLTESKLAQSNATDGWSDSSDRINVVAYRGTWFSWNPASSLFNVKHHGQSHLSGNRTGPTVRKVWIGGGNGRCGDQILFDDKMMLQ